MCPFLAAAPAASKCFRRPGAEREKVMNVGTEVINVDTKANTSWAGKSS